MIVALDEDSMLLVMKTNVQRASASVLIQGNSMN